MSAIHFIEYKYKLTELNRESNEWESGFWTVSKKAADKLVAENGDIYLHEHKSDPSRFGGKVLGYRLQEGGELDGKVIFHFRFTPAHRGVRTSKEGWGFEKKYVDLND